MSKAKQKYLAAYIPEVKPKETPKRSGMKSDSRLDEIEEAIRAFNDLLTKQNRDNLDAMYNIDMDNMSSSMRRLFQSYDDGITKANASIETWAKDTEAGFKEIAEWQSQTNKSISSIEGKADANTASITLLNQWKTDASSSLAAVQTKASQNEAQITALASWKDTAEDEVDGLAETMAVIEATADENGARIDQIVSAIGEDGEVTFASIAAGVAEDESFIELIADKVDISGFVTFESLETAGDATVNGNNIALIADAYCDSISQLRFKKWRYTDYDYNTEDNRLVDMAAIKSIDNGSTDEDSSRYALLIQTFDTRFNNDLYDVALKLVAQGAFSVETNYSAYIFAGEYCTIDALWNTRIRADRDYDDAKNASAIASSDYSFNTDGIYYGKKRIVDNSQEV